MYMRASNTEAVNPTLLHGRRSGMVKVRSVERRVKWKKADPLDRGGRERREGGRKGKEGSREEGRKGERRVVWRVGGRE